MRRFWAWVNGRIVVMLAEAMAAARVGEATGDDDDEERFDTSGPGPAWSRRTGTEILRDIQRHQGERPKDDRPRNRMEEVADSAGYFRPDLTGWPDENDDV